MSFVLPRVRAGSEVPTIHAANAVYALNEVRARRGGLWSEPHLPYHP